MSACGPSRHRSTVSGPWAVRPNVMTSRSRALDHDPAIRPDASRVRPVAGRSRSRTRRGSELPDVAGRRPARSRAISAAVARGSRSTTTSARSARPCRLSVATSPVSPASRRTASTDTGRSSAESATARTTTPTSRAARSVAVMRGSGVRSTTTTSHPPAGPPAASPGREPATARRRAVSWVSHAFRSSSSAGPHAFVARTWTARGARWGSQRAQFQSRNRPGSVSSTRSTSPGACSAVAWAITARSAPRARSRGPTTARPPLVRRSTVTGWWGEVARSWDPSGRTRVTRVVPGPLPTRTVSTSTSPRDRLQSRRVRRRAAATSAARSGWATSVARTSAATASASVASAAITSSAWAAASRRPLRRPDQRSESHVPSAITGLSSAKNRKGGVCSNQAISTPPTAGSATATQASRRRGGCAGGRGNGISMSVTGRPIRGVGRTSIRPAVPVSSAAGASLGPVTVSALAPRRRIAPVGQVRGLVPSSAPSSRLPLVEPRSMTPIDPPPTSTATCRRDTSASSRRTLASLPRPMTCCPWPSGMDRPASGPPTTRSSRALDRERRSLPGTGPPSPRTAPCPSSGAESCRSSGSRAEAAQSPATGVPSAMPSGDRTSPSRSSSRAVTSTSTVVLPVDSVQVRGARRAVRSGMGASVTGASWLQAQGSGAACGRPVDKPAPCGQLG